MNLIGPIPPEYEHVFSDNERTILAREFGTIVQRFDIVFDHRHPALGRGRWDEGYLRDNSPEQYEKGREIFERRKAAGFPRAVVEGWK